MADLKKQLKDFKTIENSIGGSEYVFVSQNGNTRKTTINDVKNFTIGTEDMGTSATTIKGAIKEHEEGINNIASQLNNSTNEINNIKSEYAKKTDINVLASNKADKIYVDKIASEKANKTDLTSPFNFKGSCLSTELPAGANVNDTYYCTDLKYRKTWNGTSWEQSSLSESNYSDELNSINEDIDYIKTEKVPLEMGTFQDADGKTKKEVNTRIRNVKPLYIKTMHSIVLADDTRMWLFFLDKDLNLISADGWKTGTVLISDFPGNCEYINFSFSRRSLPNDPIVDYFDFVKYNTVYNKIIDNDIKELKNNVNKILGIDNDHDYATKYHDKEDELYNKVIADIDDNTLVFTLVADSHYAENRWYNSLPLAKIARKISENIGVDFNMHIGDMIYEDDENPQIVDNIRRIKEYMEECRKSNIPFIYALGHHEMYPWISENDYSLPQKKVLGLCSRYNRYINCVYDPNNHGNYYFDHPSGIRIIVVDSNYKKWGVTEETINWTRDIALKTTNKVVIISHSQFDFNSGGNGGYEIYNGDWMQDMLAEASCDIIAHIHGHTHADNIRTTAKGLTEISVLCGAPMYYEPTKPADSQIYERHVGTYSEYALDIVCIHSDTGEIKMFRFGAGVDRTYTPTP